MDIERDVFEQPCFLVVLPSFPVRGDFLTHSGNAQHGWFPPSDRTAVLRVDPILQGTTPENNYFLNILWARE